MEQGHVVPAAELSTDLALDADELEAMAFVEGDTGLLRPDDAGENGVEPVEFGRFDQPAEQIGADAGALVVPSDVDGVLHRCPVAGAVAIKAEAGETHDPRISLGHEDGEPARAILDPAFLLGNGPRNQIEGGGALGDLPVVDGADRFGVGCCGLADLHRQRA